MRCIALIGMAFGVIGCTGGSLDFEGVDSSRIVLPKPVASPAPAPPVSAPSVAPPAPLAAPPPGPGTSGTTTSGSDSTTDDTESPPDAPPTPCALGWTFGEPPTAANLPAPYFQLDFDGAAELFAPAKGVTLYDDKQQPLTAQKEFPQLGTFVDGRAGRALHLQHGYLALDPQKVLPLTGGATPLKDGSMALWIGTESFQAAEGKTAQLVHSDNVAGKGWIFNLDVRTKTLRFFAEQQATKNANGQNYVEYAIGTPINEWAAGGWHHVVLTWKRLSPAKVLYRLYIDGRLIDADVSKNFPTGNPLPQHLYLLSTKRWANHQADGRFRIDLFRTYATALTHEQIVTLYRAHLDHAGPALTAGRLQMQLLGTADGYGLAGIRDTTDGLAKTMRAPSRQLWQVVLRSVTNPKLVFILNNEATGHGARECLFAAATQRMTLTWRDIPLPVVDAATDADDRLHVTMTLTAHPEHEITAQLQVDNATADWTLLRTVFPRVGGIGPIKSDPAATVLVRPGPNIGSVRRQPFTKDLWIGASDTNLPLPSWDMNRDYPSADAPMPWVALHDTTDPTGGLWVGMLDPGWAIKTIRVQHVVRKTLTKDTTDPGLDISMTTSVAGVGVAGNDAPTSATAVIRLQDGGWFAMAQRYRQFLATQSQMAAGTLAARLGAGTVAAAPLNTGIFHTSSAFAGSLQQLTAEITAQKGPPGLVWWEHSLWQQASNYTVPGVDEDKDGKADPQQSQDNNFPFATPASPASFKNNLTAAQPHAVNTIYFLPTVWDLIHDTGSPQINTASWFTQQGATMSIVDAQGVAQQGTVLAADLQSAFPKPSELFARMCPAAPPWHDILLGSLGGLMAYTQNGQPVPLQGFYLDEVARRLPTVCFATNHGHAPGDPTTYAQGFRTILSQLRAQTGAVLASEGFSDPYFDLLDGNLIEYLPWFEEELVPITIATTHDYTQFLSWRTDAGNESPAAMIAKQSQIFAWGGAPGGVLGAASPKLRAHVVRLGILRQQWKPWLIFGRMEHPLQLRWLPPGAAPPPPTPSLTPVVTGQEMPVQTLTVYPAIPNSTMTLPAVASSVWTAPNGKVGILIASLEANPAAGNRLVVVPIDRASLGLAGDTSHLTLHHFTDQTPLPDLTGSGGVVLTIEPQQAYLLEIE